MTGGGRQLGVEEEFLLVDAGTGLPAPRIRAIFPDASAAVGDDVQRKLHRAQIEIATPPCDSLSEVNCHLARLHAEMAAAAAAHGVRVLAAGTYPGRMGEAGRLLTPDFRYLWLERANGLVAREQLICGCHVHVTVDDPDRAVAIMNIARRWMPPIIAMAANSPYWEGEETGFESFRTEVWTRWPTAGQTGAFHSHGEYLALVDQLVASGVILDRGMAYWDIRPSDRFPTLEFRVADVMLDVTDAVLVAGLLRALVEACEEATDQPELRPELLRAANWRAARTGLSDVLMDPADGSVAPAGEMVGRLIEFIRPGLDRYGDGPTVDALWSALVEKGTGADRQRRAFAARRSVDDVVALAALEVPEDRAGGGKNAGRHTAPTRSSWQPE